MSKPRDGSSQSSVIPDRDRPSDEVLNGTKTSPDRILQLINEKRKSAVETDRMRGFPIFGARDTDELMKEFQKPKEDTVSLVLKPSLGRTVEINSKIDVGRGFRLLEQSCARNKVRSDFTKQRFHERPGMKRKRLGRERWRRRFMEGFKAAIVKVKKMSRQGW